MIDERIAEHSEDILRLHNTKSGVIFIFGTGPSLNGVTDIWTWRVLEKSSHPGWDMQRFHVCWPGGEYPRHDAYAYVEKAAEWKHMDQTGFVGLGCDLPLVPTDRTTPLTNAQLAALRREYPLPYMELEEAIDASV